MKTSMVFPIRFWALVLASLLVYQFSSEAVADSCKFEKKIDMTLDLSNSELLATGSGNSVLIWQVPVSEHQHHGSLAADSGSRRGNSARC